MGMIDARHLLGESGVNLLNHLYDDLPVLPDDFQIVFKRPQHLLRPRRIPVPAPKALQFNDLRGYDALGFGDMPVGFGKPL